MSEVKALDSSFDHFFEEVRGSYRFLACRTERYLRWLGSVTFQGELGWSLSRNRPVSGMLRRAVANTLVLTLTALVIHLVAGFVLGIVSAVYRGRWPDR